MIIIVIRIKITNNISISYKTDNGEMQDGMCK